MFCQFIEKEIVFKEIIKKTKFNHTGLELEHIIFPSGIFFVQGNMVLY